MNTTQFLTRLKQHIQLPETGSEDWPDTEILAEATQALYERYAQAFQVLRMGYWLHREVSAMTTGVAFYRMPARSIVQGLEKIEYSPDQGQSWRQLIVLTDPQAGDYERLSARGEPRWFSLESDGVIVYPTPSQAFPLRMSYYLRPSQLIPVNPEYTVISATSTDVTVSGVVDPTALLAPSGMFDIVNTTGCNEVAQVNMPKGTIADLGSDVWRIGTTGLDTSRVRAGQVVRAPDTTDWIPLPVELHNSLVDWTGASILTWQGDLEKAGQLAGKAESAIKRIVDAAVPRVKSAPPRWLTKNTYLRRRVGRGINNI